jgi:hypothetical protein
MAERFAWLGALGGADRVLETRAMLVARKRPVLEGAWERD